MAHIPRGEIIEFGPYRVFRHERSLFGPDGELVLGNRAFDILLVLLERADRVVSKDELLELVWPGLTVEENNLQVHVSALRKALGKEMVNTIPGRGYKYVGAAPRILASEPTQPAATDQIFSPFSLARVQRAAARERLSPMPVYATRLIGRDEAQSTLRSQVRANRLTTIVGPGGVGKTRLAIAVARDMEREFSDGVYFIDLSGITDSLYVGATAAKALGITLTKGETALESIRAELVQGRRLLILDNCEHVLQGAAELADTLLSSEMPTHILATSREPIALAEEKIYRLSPLPLPQAPESEPSQIAASDAVRLFIDRAGIAEAGIADDRSTAVAIAEICRRLDGMPLGLEMAAAHAQTLGVKTLSEMLQTKFRLGLPGERIAAARHKTLATVIEWSVALLPSEQKALLRRLAVFPAHFDLAGAFALAGEPGEQDWRLAERLNELARKSLVATDGEANRRFRLLETVKAYARELPGDEPEDKALHRKHALLTLKALRESLTSWPHSLDGAWLERFAGAIEDLRASLNWCKQTGDWLLFGQLAGAAFRLWLQVANPAEGLEYALTAVERANPTMPATDVAAMKLAVGELAAASALHTLGQQYAEEAIPLFRELGDAPALITVLARVGFALTCHQQHQKAAPYFQEAMSLLNGVDDPKLRAYVTLMAGMNRAMLGDRPGGMRMCQLGLELHQANEERLGYRRSLLYLAECAFWCGDVETAIQTARHLVDLLREDRMPRLLAFALCNLTTYRLFAGHIGEARGPHRECLPLILRLKGTWRSSGIQNEAFIAANDGDFDNAARLLGYSDQGFANSTDLRQPTEEMARQKLLSDLEVRLKPKELRRLMAEGATWTDRMVERHLSSLKSG